ncbi:MAG TPA: hypothetical protein VG895_02305 [Patescibacteria group bacterium]|nr:hypothetical protein [Patescibacteria group bacterium]
MAKAKKHHKTLAHHEKEVMQSKIITYVVLFGLLFMALFTLMVVVQNQNGGNQTTVQAVSSQVSQK